MLEGLIRDLTLSPDGPQVKSIQINRYGESQSSHEPVDADEGNFDFHPYLVVNKATDEIEATQAAMRILDVSKRWLSKRLPLSWLHF